MKLASEIAKNMVETSDQPRLVQWQAIPNAWMPLDRPTLSNELDCPTCGSVEHYTVFCDPIDKTRKDRVWVCANGGCDSNKQVSPFVPFVRGRQ